MRRKGGEDQSQLKRSSRMQWRGNEGGGRVVITDENEGRGRVVISE
jgi:hypothetical protein